MVTRCEATGTAVERSSAVDWARARCRDGSAALVALFFSEVVQEIEQAKAICAGCPLREPCLAGAVERREPWGVWGGQLFSDGKVLAIKRGRGRPRKDAEAQLSA